MGFATDWCGGATMKRALLRIDEVRQILGCSKDHIYDLLRDGKLQAHNPTGRPSGRGTKIVATSVDMYISTFVIRPEDWNK